MRLVLVMLFDRAGAALCIGSRSDFRLVVCLACSDDSVDWRVIGEVEVEGKIKAN